jgi:hypothetical protein
MSRLPLRVLLAVALVAALAPAAAVAADDPAAEGTGANVTPVANLEYTEAYGTGKNQGTDLEFAVLTVPGSDDDLAAASAGDGVDKAPKGKGNGKGKKGGATPGENPAPEPIDGDLDPDAPGIQRQYAVAGSYDNGMHIIDISDPANPVITGVYDCGISQGDVQVFNRDGRTYATFTADAVYTVQEESQCVRDAKAMGLYEGADVSDLAIDVFGDYGTPGIGTYIADITDPTNPVTVSYVATAKGSHNQTVHPSGLYLYESNSELYTTAADAGIEVFDISDFSAPERIAKVTLPPTPGLGSESHDLTFNADGTRAYTAALSQSAVINTEDPRNPSLVSVIIDPAINVHHQASPATLTDATTGMERTFLFIEDEVAGALGTGQCPNGGVHVYDITGPLENAPVKVGYWNIDEVRETDKGITNTGTQLPFGWIEMHSCTAHVFEIHENEALMTIAYYNGGVRVVDLSGIVGVALGGNGVGMSELGFYRFPDSNTWAVKAPTVSRDGFYLYGNDQDRGFDVYRYEPSDSAGATATAAGQWLTPAQIAAKTAANPAPALSAETAPYCLLRTLNR